LLYAIDPARVHPEGGLLMVTDVEFPTSMAATMTSDPVAAPAGAVTVMLVLVATATDDDDR
jgi:hypothetical protein